jgi:hypothetical protein
MADFLSTLFSGGAETEAADKDRAPYQQNLTSGENVLNTALPNQTAPITGAIGSLTDLANKYGGATNKYDPAVQMYMNALGINGPQGTQQAQSAFTTSPGYQQGITSGLDAINRRRSLAGMGDSGNADIDALTLGQNAQNKEYGGWLSNLQSLVSPDVSTNALNTNANVGLTTSAAGMAPQLSNIYGTNATQNIGLLNDETSGMANANQLQAAGEASGAKNLMNAAFGVGSMLMGMPPGSLSSLGGGGGGTALSMPQNYSPSVGRYGQV